MCRVFNFKHQHWGLGLLLLHREHTIIFRFHVYFHFTVLAHHKIPQVERRIIFELFRAE